MTRNIGLEAVPRARKAQWVVLGTVAVLGFVASAGPAGSQAWSGKQETRDGVTWVLNPAEPSSTPVVAEAKELWRAGGEGDDEVLFGVISQITTDSRGNVYILDSQLNQVMILSPNGEQIRAIGREGEGPGEFQRPSDLFLTADGNVAVLQRMPGRIVLLTPEGEPLGNMRIPETAEGGMQMFSNGRLAGENVVLNVSRFARRDDGFDTINSLFSVDREGNLVSTFFAKKDEGNFANMVFDEKKMGPGALVWSAGLDGRVYTSDSFDGYRYQVWSPAGKLERVVEKEYTPRKRSSEEMKRYAPVVRIQQGDRAQSPEVKASETDRDIQQIFPRGNGEVWVLSSMGAFGPPPGAIASFDVFDGTGKFTGRTAFNGTGSYAEDGLYLVGDRLYVVTGLRSARRAMFGASEGAAGEGEDTEQMEVICYELGATTPAAK
ncbi:MAG: hypothetical protein H6Q78_1054 [Candidatus Krumholzibacteriota bacterium]|nr:hypothetical protein [Candidatus Krumholzibacteriota bacterium]